MKKLVVIVATLALLLLVFAPATYAAPPAQGGGYGGGGYGGYDDGYGGGYGGGWQNCQGTCYKVKYGDNLFRIGLRFGVHYSYIAQVNGLPSPHRIYAGQVLYIPPSPCCGQKPVGMYPQPYPGYPHPMPPIHYPGYPHPMPPIYSPEDPHVTPYSESNGGYGYENNDGYAYGAPDQGYGNY
ncbi:MAG TPA: LysM peptidoglycan-binding domain-containing protein [Anaerolineae bacterium]|nr:LysM peptidoglycan-binding domain-containing protein [Anaerolineae bacterium]